MSQVVATPRSVRIEDPDEPFLKEAGDVAVEFINLSLPELGTTVKAPHFPKKTAGEPGLLSAEEGEVPPQAEPLTTTTELPASLPQLGEGEQAASRAATAAAGGSEVSRSRQIAERLKMIGDQLDKDIEEETKLQFSKILARTSVFMLTKESFSTMCRTVLSRFQQRFTTGWQQILVVYSAMIQTIVALREEGGDIPTQTRELQVVNFVGQTLVELQLYAWMASHGGMANFGQSVEGTDATAVIEESSVDPED